jgi:hypothetical protein
MSSTREIVIGKILETGYFNAVEVKVMEEELYKYTSQVSRGKVGFDFVSFQQKYENLFNYLNDGINSFDLFRQIIKSEGVAEAMDTDLANFFPGLKQETALEVNELRKGQYRCLKCAKNKDYCWNTSFYEKQTRSCMNHVVFHFFHNFYFCSG